MAEDQIDIEISGEVLARVVHRGQRYVLFSLDPRLRDIDEEVFDTLTAAREAVLVALDQSTENGV